jgi:quinol monooxygenase YgiN
MELHMHARVNTGRVQPNQVDEFVAALQSLLPHAKQQAKGLASVLVAGDRRTGKIVLLSRWESVAAAEAAEVVYQDAMRELGRFLAEQPTREPYEVLLEA